MIWSGGSTNAHSADYRWFNGIEEDQATMPGIINNGYDFKWIISLLVN